MKKKILRKLCVVLLALVFAAGSGMTAWQLYSRQMADRAYEEAEKLALAAVPEEPAAGDEDSSFLPELPILPDMEVPLASKPGFGEEENLPEEAELLVDMDLAALQEINADVMGWIYIPDTEISYPLMRSADNSEYLNLTWDLKYSAAGSIFLERRNSPDMGDFNTIIYGHNMKNGSMFSGLHKYDEQEYLEENPCVYIATEDAILRYEIFAAYTADVRTDTYRLQFENYLRKQTSIDYYVERSEVEGGIEPSVDDRILTLSTCTGLGNYDYRWVVQAVLTGEFAR